jgi:hypothetical protein
MDCRETIQGAQGWGLPTARSGNPAPARATPPLDKAFELRRTGISSHSAVAAPPCRRTPPRREVFGCPSQSDVAGKRMERGGKRSATPLWDDAFELRSAGLAFHRAVDALLCPANGQMKSGIVENPRASGGIITTGPEAPLTGRPEACPTWVRPPA